MDFNKLVYGAFSNHAIFANQDSKGSGCRSVVLNLGFANPQGLTGRFPGVLGWQLSSHVLLLFNILHWRKMHADWKHRVDFAWSCVVVMQQCEIHGFAS